MGDWQIQEELKGIKNAVRALERKVSTDNFSWWVPWLVGFLFTIGAYGGPQTVEGTWWEQLFAGILAFVLWPVALGAKVFPPQ